MLLDLLGALVLFILLALLFLGERIFERGRRARALPRPKRELPPTSGRRG